MVNDLVPSWWPRSKYVDDLSVLEIIPRNSPSYLPFIVDDIHQFAINNNMRLNPVKCKVMNVDFLKFRSCVWSPVVIRDMVVECVKSFKLLGIHISEDLTWDTHCDSIIKKSSKRLYALRVRLRRLAYVSRTLSSYIALSSVLLLNMALKFILI